MHIARAERVRDRRRPARPRPGLRTLAGASSAVVFLPDSTTEELAEAGPGWEYGRLDYVYADRVRQPISSIDSWPTTTRPTLDYTRFLTLPQGEGQYLYVRPVRRYRR